MSVKVVIFFRERERKRREAEEERAIEEAISEVREARRKAASRAAKHQRRRDSLKKDRLGADKEYLVRFLSLQRLQIYSANVAFSSVYAMSTNSI